MICLECGCEKFTEKKVEQEQLVSGEKIIVTTPACVCDKCGSKLFTSKQIDKLIMKVSQIENNSSN